MTDELTAERHMRSPAPGDLAAARDLLDRIVENLGRVMHAPRRALELSAVCLIAEGHLIIEDYPGVGKTTLAKALARSVGCSFSRIQFTPDLLPSDVTGVNVYSQQTGEFEFRPGPVFANLVLIDEINRASPKTQAALLECMQELQVTVDGVSYELAPPFMVMATQNPIEYEGTYPLPEAELDRFALRVSIGYPEFADEAELLVEQAESSPLDELEPVASAEEVLSAIEVARRMYVEPSMAEYVTRIMRATRDDRRLFLGASPRAGITLLRVAKALALLEGRGFVAPEDVKSIAGAVLGHRLLLSPEARAAAIEPAELVEEILARLPVPA